MTGAKSHKSIQCTNLSEVTCVSIIVIRVGCASAL